MLPDEQKKLAVALLLFLKVFSSAQLGKENLSFLLSLGPSTGQHNREKYVSHGLSYSSAKNLWKLGWGVWSRVPCAPTGKSSVETSWRSNHHLKGKRLPPILPAVFWVSWVSPERVCTCWHQPHTLTHTDILSNLSILSTLISRKEKHITWTILLPRPSPPEESTQRSSNRALCPFINHPSTRASQPFTKSHLAMHSPPQSTIFSHGNT